MRGNSEHHDPNVENDAGDSGLGRYADAHDGTDDTHDRVYNNPR